MGVDFDAARRERRNQHEPFQFTLGGETFVARATMPLGELWVDPIPEPPERFATSTAAGQSFLFLAQAICLYLDPRDRDRWWSIFDPPTEVEGADLLAVQEKLSEEVAGRSPLSPDGSAGGPNDKSGSNSNSEPDATSAADSSTSERAKGSRGSNGSPTKSPRKRAGSTSTTGSKAATAT